MPAPLDIDAIGPHRDHACAWSEREFAEVHSIARRIQVDANIVEVFGQYSGHVQYRIQILRRRWRRRAAGIRANAHVEMIPVNVEYIATRVTAEPVRDDDDVHHRSSRLSAEAMHLVVSGNLAMLVEKKFFEENPWPNLPVVTLP